MAKSFSKLKEQMSVKAQKAVSEKKEVILKEMILNEIREHLELTQEYLADKLQTKQANVSQTERRTDLKISTMKKYVEAMGGELDIVAKFPDSEIHFRTAEL